MGSSQDFVEYVREQLRPAGDISCKKMFGEYALYLDCKVIALVCDDQLFIKITETGKKILGDYETGSPYPGAKPHFLISDFENQDLMRELIQKTWSELPFPKPKKKKGAKNVV